ncbi:MAG: threonylcarbamoyl-AMP synthase [Clostridia bacterium]|nr:threonylcarbamoyl-AMP synthase [Clostridia bacterium]
MQTRVLKAKDSIDEGASLIRSGELVVFPTETVYGLGANAFDENAVKKIFIAKGRPQDNPLIVHISSLEQVRDIAVDVPEVFYELANRFMPGPITLILKKSDKIPYAVTAGGETVGVRMPSNEWARKLIEKSFPLAAPSANRSKHISPTTAKHVLDDLNGEVALIMDDGACKVGIESTVLDLTTDVPTILRPGAITAEMLVEILGEVNENGKVIKIAKAPGMKYTHYAPKVKTVCAESIDHAVREYDRAKNDGLNPVVVARDIYRDKVEDRAQISLGVTVEDYCRNIYAALHTAEDGFDYIIVEELGKTGLEGSVMNRVEKAAGGNRV